MLPFGMKTLVIYLLRTVSSLSSIGAVAFGIYLFVFALTKHDSLRTCGGGDCEEVLNSSWSVWYGIPVVSFGVAMYGAFFIGHLLVVFSKNKALRRASKWVLTFAAAMIVLGAVYFFVIQAAVLHAFCRSCMVTHGMGVLAVLSGWIGIRLTTRGIRNREDAATAPCPSKSSGPDQYSAETILLRQLRTGNRRGPDWLWSFGVAVTSFALFVVLHLFDPGPQTHLVMDALPNHPTEPDKPADRESSNPGMKSDPGLNGSLLPRHPMAGNHESKGDTDDSTSPPNLPDLQFPERSVQEKDHASRVHLVNDINFRRDRFPMVGSPDASHAIVKLFDYHCNNCRAFHRDFNKTLPEYGDQFVLILVPCPLERECHPGLPKSVEDHVHSCQLAKIALTVWRIAPEKFEEYHDWAMEEDRAPDASLARAIQVTNNDRIASIIQEETFMDDIEISSKLFSVRGGPKMPKVFLPSGRIIIGVVRSRNDLRNILDEELRILAEHGPNVTGETP